ncbi:MAG: hypothetical protein UV82_C0003G0070 [Candidatus Magasanikbacteria bacterium GW2011_GWD2_43_18]|nr:MAG: hypothetical protein UV18_C0006G0053 [Candidatus Magasanikbacteria bacterium GW2011_GWC2_42_27]KKT04970.1 MAG: hypothetical protein UV82_C0003G0070 [Candidatus Magasanikbacteria bacterium GW2011_GWD2_43_18]KKT25092.1 MAG: hypothetical protein UW10_C0014G0003 [Candidatus Magasanikbacteria bacterium GW2011_GWA2_43_9]HBB38281.1 hypothetical protein [Candidatus Magasanikbacteria bacterium]HCC13595.1 hypothetical protein [Candidatus Magasanikbacteria bacterium]
MKGIVARGLVLALLVLTPAGALLAHPHHVKQPGSMYSLVSAMWAGIEGFGLGALRNRVTNYEFAAMHIIVKK